MLKKNLLLLFAVVALALLPILFLQDAEFGGADGEAEKAITEINSEYQPWFTAIWEPPSGEIESLLFVLQGVVGALIIGYFIGYMRGKHTKNSNAKH